MSEFLTKLEVTLVDDTSNDGRGTWRVDKPFAYQSDVAHKLIIVPVGFLTDFASVPRLPVVFLLTGDSSHYAAVIHDYLYSTQLFPRKLCDQVLLEACSITGIPAWRRTLIYWGVRFGGGSHFNA